MHAHHRKRQRVQKMEYYLSIRNDIPASPFIHTLPAAFPLSLSHAQLPILPSLPFSLCPSPPPWLLHSCSLTGEGSGIMNRTSLTDSPIPLHSSDLHWTLSSTNPLFAPCPPTPTLSFPSVPSLSIVNSQSCAFALILCMCSSRFLLSQWSLGQSEIENYSPEFMLLWAFVCTCVWHSQRSLLKIHCSCSTNLVMFHHALICLLIFHSIVLHKIRLQKS